MSKQHDFTSRVVWTGNKGVGNQSYRAYDRSWNIEVPGKPVIPCSNDPLLGGDPSLMNPEDLLISALSACHMLWYLHLASRDKILVHDYQDDAVGTGESEPDGTGRFISATLRPTITVAKGTDLDAADAIHHRIHNHCFIARSVNFPIEFAATYVER